MNTRCSYIIPKTFCLGSRTFLALSNLNNTISMKMVNLLAYPWRCFNIKMDTLFTLLETDFILTQGNLS